MDTSGVSRRGFIRGMAACGLSAPMIMTSRTLGAAGRGANDRINMGCIGIRNQGGGHLKALSGNKDVRVVAVCDVDAKIREAGKAVVEKSYASQMASGAYKGCAAYNDFRELIARKDIDAVMIATPDHWHAIIAVEAMRAGKDVYCEKPLTLTIGEGRVISDVARRYGRIFQTGSQQRSSYRFRYACELVRNGRIGQVKRIEVGLPPNNAQNTGIHPPMPVPAELDYEMWLGPAPWEPYTEGRVHYFFRFILDYSGGQVTNFGAHDLDIAQWALGMDHSGPVEVDGSRGEFPTEGLYNAATKVDFECTYANGVKVSCKTSGSGVRFVGTEGWLYVNRGTLQASQPSLLTSVIGPSEVHLYNSRDHWDNFLECMRTRQQPICNAEVGHRSATVCHLGNIAMQLKRTVKWDPAKERFVNDVEADRMIDRAKRSPWQL
ncbi:MAG TPA: Gfo/Idh/MocA family oxidoreductase [Tepidisphaeraceae bacterium]|nr:Gfo/Idh/MocA family oxidoreductase [Tepidisphaeraceae bacterium]